MTQTPILLVGFNRPKAILRRLDAIERLKPRPVRITLDGARGIEDIPKILEVRKIAEEWAALSKHDVDIQVQDTNLGVLRHLPIALEKFIACQSKLIVIEDDIEFSEDFVDFVESYINKSPEIFAFQGFNPTFLKSSSLAKTIPGTVYTRIPTVWGWAARDESVAQYLKFMQTHFDLKSLDAVVKEFAKSITKDIFLQNAIRSTWLRKMNRVLKNQGGSWDNWWVLASWASNKNLLMPEISLSREESNQSEGQTHQHGRVGLVYVPFSESSFDKDRKPRLVNKQLERSRTRVWGITRKYSWVYAVRVLQNIRYFKSK